MKFDTRLLYPFSLLYRVLSKLDKGITIERKLPKPVISIGNITWGGTGKTPCVIKLAREFVSLGFKPAILSRGYFKQDKRASFIAVSDGKTTLVPPEISGDEPFLIAESVPGAIVMAGKNRVGAAGFAMEKFSPDLFILDDGFQHWKIIRDLEIVCVNALNPFGNGFLIPAGVLREPVSALNRADLVVITSSDLVSEASLLEIEKIISRYCHGKILRAKYAPVRLRRVLDGESFKLEDFKNEPFSAVSAIGENSGFTKLLEKSGINAVRQLDFRDHHWYNIDELKRLDTVYKVITTTKDAVRLKGLLNLLPHKEAERFFALEIELVLCSANSFTFGYPDLRRFLGARRAK